MGKNTTIAWTDHTFNPWIGCQKISPGCQFCYAERETFVRMQQANGIKLWGPNSVRHHTTVNYWAEPLRWNNQVYWQCTKCTWRGKMEMKVGQICPLCGSKISLARQRVFCASLADVFEDGPTLDMWRAQLFDLIAETPNLDWLILTKRIDIAAEMLPTEWLHGIWPRNAWIGTSVENQEYYDRRVPFLAKLDRAPIRFLSIEPMLGPIRLYREAEVVGFNWVIVGGESGPRCRPFDPEWARQIKFECGSIGVPFFMKQLGGHPDRREEMGKFPPDLRTRQWPAP